MFDTFAKRRERGVAGLHLVTVDDAARLVQMCVCGQPCFRADAHGHADKVRLIKCANLQRHGLDPIGSRDGLRRPFKMHHGSTTLLILLQHIARRRIKLAFHQMAHQMDDGDLGPRGSHPYRRRSPPPWCRDGRP